MHRGHWMICSQCHYKGMKQLTYFLSPLPFYYIVSLLANQFYVRGQYNKRKRMRASFTHEQVLKLQKVFQTKKYLGNSERTELAQKLKMTEQQIKIWFQNRRYKEKKQQQSEERHRLCSRVPTNMSHSGLDHDRVNDIGRYVKSEAEEYVEIDWWCNVLVEFNSVLLLHYYYY